jgi:2-methylcitrate dehydratase PrpD
MAMSSTNWPATGSEGKLSLAYNVAAAIVDGGVIVDTFEDECIPHLAVARDRIRVTPRGDLSQYGCRVGIRTVDGRTFSKQSAAPGSREFPLGWKDLAIKFAANARAMVGDGEIGGVIECIAKLEEQHDLSGIVRPLVPGDV